MIEKTVAIGFTLLVLGIFGCVFREEYDPRGYRLPRWFGGAFVGMFVSALVLLAVAAVVAVLAWAF